MTFPSFLAPSMFAAAVVLTLTGPAAAQQLPADQRQLIDRVVAADDRGDSPGCALAVHRNGEIAFPAGSEWLYSNTGCLLLGEIVKRVSGQSLREFAAGLMAGSYGGLATVRHGGSWAGYRADLLRFPTARTSIACLCNVGSSIPSLFADSVADIVLASRLAPKAGPAAAASRPAVAVEPARLDSLAGYYEHGVTGAFRRLTVKDGALMAFGQRSKAVSADRYAGQAPGLELHFPPVSAGSLQEMHIIRTNLVFTRR